MEKATNNRTNEIKHLLKATIRK